MRMNIDVWYQHTVFSWYFTFYSFSWFEYCCSKCNCSPSYSIDNSDYCRIEGKKFFQVEMNRKNYLRTTMTQERLHSLAMISIEWDIIQSLDYSQFIQNFAAIKAQKVDFLRFMTSACVHTFQLFVDLDINIISF